MVDYTFKYYEKEGFKMQLNNALQWFTLPSLLTESNPWHGHIPFAFWLTELLEPELIVELGVHKGDSYCAFCQSVKHLSLNTLCYGVDTWQGDKHAGYYGDEVYQELKEYHDPMYGNFSQLIRSTFDDALPYFSNKSIDILHIDGLHTYEAVLHDFESWLPKVSEKGVILLHDISERNNGFGVWRFWDEIKDLYPSFAFYHSHGLGVLAVGKEAKELLSPLINSSGADRNLWMTFFSTLGSRVNYYWAFNRVQKENGKLLKMIEELQRTKANDENIELQLLSRVDELQVQIESLTQQAIIHMDEILIKNSTIEKLTKQRDDYADLISNKECSKDQVIQEQKLDLESMRRVVTDLKLQLQDSERLLENHKQLISDYAASNSWRITKPLRYIGRVLKGRGMQYEETIPEISIDKLRPEHSVDQISINTHYKIRRTVRSFRRFQVLFISGMPKESASYQYRVAQIMSGLDYVNIFSVAYLQDEVKNLSTVLQYDIVVFFRVAWDDQIERVVSLCRENSIITVFDTDDYIVEPKIVSEQNIDGLRYLNERERELYNDGVIRYRRTLMNVDYSTASTSYLARQLTELGKETRIIRNFLSVENTTLIDNSSGYSRSSEEVVIGYASGTMTHQKDFRVALFPLIEIMGLFPDVRIHIIGDLDINDFGELISFHERIIITPKVPLEHLPIAMKQFDVNIAPLEIGNPFCESKSEIKYMDAAIIGVPTVASATQPYKDAIVSGRTGFLAQTQEDWVVALSRLIVDPSLRKKIGEAAKHHVRTQYSYMVCGEIAKKAYGSLILDSRRKDGIGKNIFTLSFLVPPISKGSGGHSKIMSIAKGMARRGHMVSIYIEALVDSLPTTQSIQEEYQLRKENIDVIVGFHDIRTTDAIVATFWKTAFTAKQVESKADKLFYLIQDYEPYFYPMSTEYLLSEQSYQLGLRGISYGSWCKEIIRKRHSVEVENIGFYIDKQIYKKVTSVLRQSNRILLFTRADMPRRCFDLGFQAMEKIYQKCGNRYHLSIFGSILPPDLASQFPFEDLGILHPTELTKLYSSSTIGLAFSTTNPSMIPFEMLACGLPVIDLDYGDNSVNYGEPGTVTLVPPDPNLIADAAIKLMQEEELRNEMSEKGYRFVSSFPDEEQVIEEFENIILGNLSTMN